MWTTVGSLLLRRSAALRRKAVRAEDLAEEHRAQNRAEPAVVKVDQAAAQAEQDKAEPAAVRVDQAVVKAHRAAAQARNRKHKGRRHRLCQVDIQVKY